MDGSGLDPTGGRAACAPPWYCLLGQRSAPGIRGMPWCRRTPTVQQCQTNRRGMAPSAETRVLVMTLLRTVHGQCIVASFPLGSAAGAGIYTSTRRAVPSCADAMHKGCGV